MPRCRSTASSPCTGHARLRPALQGWRGCVIADWPGLKPASLHDGRDLKPTTDLRAVLKGVLAGQFGLSEAVLAGRVFPDSGMATPLSIIA